MKTVLAPASSAHAGRIRLVLDNILGNRDGEVLDDPQSFKTKEESKLVAGYIFQPELYPDLYKNLYTRFASTITRPVR